MERAMINFFEQHYRWVAAVTIQKHIRGFLSRLALYNSLSQEVDSMSKARGGSTSVYLPGKFSKIVLKQSGEGKAKARLLQMRRARTILEAQNCRHLEIPLATLCGKNHDFLAETRLKIEIDSSHNWQLYLTNPQRFDNVVREMTRLFSKVFISRMTLDDEMSSLKIPMPRYDNFPLGKEGGISLIDLENIVFTQSDNAPAALASFFPLHIDTIKEEWEKLGWDFRDSKPLERTHKMVALAKSHLTYLQEHELDRDNPEQFLNLTEKRREEITKAIEDELAPVNEFYQMLVSHSAVLSNPDFQQYLEDLATAKEIAPKICATLIDRIKAAILEHPVQTEEIPQPLLTKLGLENFVPRYVEFKRIKLYEAFDTAYDEMIPGLLNGKEIFYFDSQRWSANDSCCRIYF